MPFADPSPTPADLHFRVLGFPVRVHPFFWLMCVLLGPKEPLLALLWAVSVFVSILVHELGHTLVQRRFGGRPSIVLYSFGGLAFANGADDSPRKQILISLAGPFAGFALAAVLAGGVALTGHTPVLRHGSVLFAPYASPVANELLENLFWINIWWGLINLLPVYPLDGGQVARELLVLFTSRGVTLSLWLSIICAGGMVAVCLTGDRFFTGLLFASLAFNNYQTLDAYNRSRRGGW